MRVSRRRRACGDALVTVSGSTCPSSLNECPALSYVPFGLHERVAFLMLSRSCFFGTLSTSVRRGSAFSLNPFPKNLTNVALSARNHASMHCTMRWAFSSVAPSGGVQLSRLCKCDQAPALSDTGASLSTSRTMKSRSVSPANAARKSSKVFPRPPPAIILGIRPDNPALRKNSLKPFRHSLFRVLESPPPSTHTVTLTSDCLRSILRPRAPQAGIAVTNRSALPSPVAARSSVLRSSRRRSHSPGPRSTRRREPPSAS